MAQPYLGELQSLIRQVRCLNEDDNSLICKHFFSGAAAYTNGHIFMSLSPAGLALKLPQFDCKLLIKKGAKPLQYFPKSPIKKGYVVLPQAIISDPISLESWVKKSLDYVQLDSV